jgi:hypothetical protein
MELSKGCHDQDWFSPVVGRIDYEIGDYNLFLGFVKSDRFDSFVPTRGIHQGDPISCYLFLLAAKGLSCLLNVRIQSSKLKGIKVAASLFFRADRESANTVMDVQNIYC